MTRLHRTIRLIGALFALAAAPASADVAPAGGSLPVGIDTDAPRESHGWATLQTTSGRWELIHFPPEVISGSASRSPEAGPGSVHVARRLLEPPQAIAAWERHVYIAFLPRRVDADNFARDIRAMTIAPAPIRGLWQYGETDRLEALPSLPGRGRLLGFVGTDAGLAALLESNGLELRIHRDREWVRVPLPESSKLAGVGRTCGLVALERGLGLWVEAGAESGLWAARFDPENSDPDWTWTPIRFGAGPTPTPFASASDELIYWYRTHDAVHLRAAGPNGDRALTRVDGVPDTFAPVPKSGVGAVAILWPATSPDSHGRDRRGFEVREYSLASGRLRYSGPGIAKAPLSRPQSQLIALTVLGVTLIILVSAVRQGDPGYAPLPAGCALAPPLRRLAAAGLDFFPALYFGTKLAGAISEDCSPMALAGPAQNAILLALGLAWLHTTIAESLWHRSLGKLLAGIAVVSVRTATLPNGSIIVPLRKPTLIESGLRNLVKWWLCPVAFFGIMTTSRRHRGDIISRSAVVAPADHATG